MPSFSSLVVTALLSAPPAAASETPQYVLQVGERSYEVTNGKPLTITTPKGERVELVLTALEERRWSGDGIQLRYPSAMQLTREESDGLVTLTFEATNSALAILQLYPRGVSSRSVQQALEQALVSEFVARGAKVSLEDGQPVSRKIGGQELKGSRYEFRFAGESFVAEICSGSHKRRVFGLLLQSSAEDQPKARAWFETILTSLR